MTTGNKTDVDLRSRTLFAEDCFLAGRIAGLESAVKAWDLDDQAAVQCQIPRQWPFGIPRLNHRGNVGAQE